MLRVGPSELTDAGEGLFAVRFIPRGTLIPVEPSTPQPRPAERGDNLEFYLDRRVDPATPCLFDGRLCTLGDVRRDLDPSVYTPSYVHARPDDPLMKANDRAWPADAPDVYEARASARNAIEFVLAFERGRAAGIRAHFLRDVAPGEEIGATYGWGYWTES